MASKMGDEPLQHDTDNKEVTATASATEKQVVNKCKFCKRPSQCPTCGKEPDPPKKQGKDGTVDIDGEIEDTYHQLPPYNPNDFPPPHKNFHHCMPPVAITEQEYSVFLAGSIEMGRAVQWQRQMAHSLSDLPISVYNPRRGHWNPEATQEAKNEEFRHQVEWELNALTKAKVICFFFDHTTMSPVTMMELGLWAHSGKVVVCCNKQFWKGGNVDIVCERYGIPRVETFEELVPLIRAMLRQKGMTLDKDGNLTKKDEDPEIEKRLPGETVPTDASQKSPTAPATGMEVTAARIEAAASKIEVAASKIVSSAAKKGPTM